MLIILVIGTVAGIYVMRFAISPSVGGILAQTSASVINSLLIEVMNYIYSFLAYALTEWENFRTETSFENSIITKIFIFQFINSYASFFYLAFVAQSVGECSVERGCMPDLAYNIGIIFATRLISGNFIVKFMVPYFLYLKNIQLYRQRVQRDHITVVEREFLKDPVSFWTSSCPLLVVVCSVFLCFCDFVSSSFNVF